MKRIRALLVTFGIALLLVFAPSLFATGKQETSAGTTPSAPVRSVELRFAHTDPPGGPREQAAQFFAQKVAEYTQGRYKVTTFPSGTLGNDTKLLEQQKLGAIDFVVTGAAIYGVHHEPMSLTLCPFLVETLEQGWHLYDDSDWVKARFAELEGNGFKMLATWEAGFRNLTTRKPVKVPADVRGMKLRVPPNPIHLAIWTTLKANPVSMGINEVYLAIQQGVVDGQENPIPTIHTNKFYEVAPNITLTNHVYGPIPLSVGMKTWEKLSAEDKAAVQKAAKEAAEYSRTLVKNETDDMIRDMESKGATVIRPDLKLWFQTALPAYDEIRKKFGAEFVDSLLKETEQIKAKYPAK